MTSNPFRDVFKRKGITGRTIRRGEIYLVKDDILILPEERLPERPTRKSHEQRPVLVLQANPDNDDPFYLSVLVAPLSDRIDLQDQRDFKLLAGQGGVDRDSVAQLGLIQPVLKIDLQSDPIGRLDDLTINDIDAVLAANLGLIERPSE